MAASSSNPLGSVADIFGGGVITPVITGNFAQPTTTSGGLTEFLLLLIGIILVTVSFEYSPRFGALILFIIVLLMLRSAQSKGLI